MECRLSKDIFSQQAVIEAARAYSHLALISIEEQDNYWQIQFTECRYAEYITVREFENYLIILENR